MNRIILIATATVLLTAATGASAFSISVDFPTLTYPPIATPDTTQGPTDLPTCTNAVCTVPAK